MTTDAFEIEKGIKIPPKAVGRPKGSGKYIQLLQRMKVGDSTIVKTIGSRATLFCAARSLGVVVISRKVEGGYRIWRDK